MVVHSNQARLLASNIDMKNLKYLRKFIFFCIKIAFYIVDFLAVSTIYKEILGKSRRYNCPFCKRFASSSSSAVLNHIKVCFSFID